MSCISCGYSGGCLFDISSYRIARILLRKVSKRCVGLQGETPDNGFTGLKPRLLHEECGCGDNQAFSSGGVVGG